MRCLKRPQAPRQGSAQCCRPSCDRAAAVPRGGCRSCDKSPLPLYGEANGRCPMPMKQADAATAFGRKEPKVPEAAQSMEVSFAFVLSSRLPIEQMRLNLETDLCGSSSISARKSNSKTAAPLKVWLTAVASAKWLRPRKQRSQQKSDTT